MNYFQKKLLQIMQDKNLKQVDIAEMANTSQTTVSKWLRMENLPRVSSIEPLAKALNTSVGELIGDFSYKPSLTEDDKKLLALTARQKKILLKYIDFLSEIEDL
ncbi:MAG: helix-turn-helix transcriptional regulator [Candidatus Riflebacteria bacterium]|nr:helix-turn-helix transcriptional regulator [Candidatus Riflebacteria bacterium]